MSSVNNIDNPTINIDPLIGIVNQFVFYATILCFFIIISIFILNIINFIILIFYIITDIINLIFNNNYIYANSFKLSLMDCISCTNTDYSKDKLYIFVEENFVLTLLTILFYILMFLLLPFVLYLCILIYSYIYDYKTEGNIKYDSISIIILISILIYCLIHIGFYVLFFQNNIIKYYISSYNQTSNIDNTVKKTLYKAKTTNANFINNLYNYGKLLDLDEFNNVLNENINDANVVSGLLLSYNIYNYFHSHISVSDTNNYSNLITYINGTENNISLFSLLNMQEITAMNKYYDDLNIFNNQSNISEDYLSNIYSGLNDTNNVIDNINNYILNNNNLNVPTYLILLYIIIITFFTVILIYIIILIISNSTSEKYSFMKDGLIYIYNKFKEMKDFL